MENTLPDDVFISRDVANRRPSSSRIHFPSNKHNLPRQGRHRPELPRTPSVGRGSPLNPQKVHQAMDLGRRPRSSHTDMPVASPDSSLRQRRNTSIGLGDAARDLDLSADEALEVGVFSNEYDLSHEDPRILQDVQRALKMKARREARLKQINIVGSNFTEPKQTSVAAQPQTPPSNLKLTSSPSFSPSSRKLSISPTSDVDFSPSTAIPEFFVQPAHPIPSSLDNGMTLDWTGTIQDDADRRWSISIGKKKGKDKLPPLGTTMIDQQQDQVHKAKLSQISSLASSQTNRKASITSEQLGRRYGLIYESLASEQVPLSLVQIARWSGTQDELVRKSLEKAEPFTWLKHLDKGTSKSCRSSRYLSALIIEMYVHAQNRRDRMQANSEDSAILESQSRPPRKSRSPSSLSPSGTGLANVRGSSKSTNLISFEPKAARTTTATDTAFRKSADSAFSSGPTGSSVSSIAPPSPVSSRLNDFGEKADDRHKTSGDTSSSNGSEASDKEVAQLFISVPDFSLQPPSSEDVAARHATIPMSLRPASSIGSLESTNPPPVQTISSENQSLSSLKSSKPRRIRMSLHGSRPGLRGSLREDGKEALRLEYEAKATLLQESIAHNHRIRQLLNRISAAVKEYDAIQTVAFNILEIDQPCMSRDVLEAFGHDPSAVTGSTRRLRGWRVVEDINQRLIRQRNVLKTFRSPLAENVSTRGCLLDESIENLLQALEDLEGYRDTIALRAESILNLRNSVQRLHAKVKENYKVTISRASVVYPELSQIVVLEESYKDQYQHFWELGMDALTLFLDTVTPFWRTYGKLIGEDVRDFLIIPLYRNEYTGELKRYPIMEIPRRSLRHWLGLVFFFFLTIGIIILQVRAAISSSLHFRLRLIPYDGIRWTALPFFWIGILVQWLAVIFELAIVFMQVGVITWWTGWSVNILS